MLLWVLYAVVAWALMTAVFWGWTRFSVQRVAQLLTNEAFSSGAGQAQIIDGRESAAFKKSHILGARNMPVTSLVQGKSGLRYDKPIYVYAADLRSAAPVVKQLHKQGYGKEQLFVLKTGFANYDGKKTQKK